MSAPREPSSASNATPHGAFRITRDQRGVGCVAIVDDDLGIAQAIGDWLEFEGITYQIHDSAEAMLQTVSLKDHGLEIKVSNSHQSMPLMAAIVDVNLPGQNGLVLAENLRQLAPTLPIVMISAMRAIDVNKFGTLPPHTPFLSKPFDLTALESALLDL